jgi:4-hydroxy-2-oxoheptanedioate aldolase
MTARRSRLRRLLLEGNLPKTIKINLADPRVIEIAALSGIDAVWLCCEHVPNDWINLENMIRAARLHGIDSLVRVAKGSYSDYIKPLEAGATGIIVPHVGSAEEARRVVASVRFHPLGQRALDGGNADAHFCALPMEDYVRHANDECIVICQIESPEALEEVDRIAEVPGFDGLLFGPGDFSHRVGKLGRLDHPDVVAARQRVAAAAAANGKFAMAAGLSAPLPQLLEEGHNVINVGADVVTLFTAVKERIGAIDASARRPAVPASPYR